MRASLRAASNFNKSVIAAAEPANRQPRTPEPRRRLAQKLNTRPGVVPYLSEGLLGRIQIGPGRRVGHGRPPHALMVGRDGVCRACHGLADGVTTCTMPTSRYSLNRLWSAVQRTHTHTRHTVSGKGEVRDEVKWPRLARRAPAQPPRHPVPQVERVVLVKAIISATRQPPPAHALNGRDQEA